LKAAWKLARDVETLADLLAGCPIDQNRLNPEGLRWAMEHRLVRLERPIDLLIGEVA
jgi:hypothetical protein